MQCYISIKSCQYSLDTAEEEEHLVYVEDLQKQNSNLKQLIGEMRSQMETLGHAEGNANTNAVKGMASTDPRAHFMCLMSNAYTRS